MEFFNPVEIKEYYVNRVASEMSKYFYDNIFNPIFEILNDNSVINSRDELLNAIKNGRIYYKDGAFRTGDKFTNGISKTLEGMGAKFRNGAYYIAKTAIPLEYMQALGIAEAMTSAKLALIGKFLSSFDFSKLNLTEYIKPIAAKMFKSLEKDILNEMQSKNVPVIELGIVKYKPAEFPKEELKQIKDYWQAQTKASKTLYKQIKEAEKQEADKSKKPPEISSEDLKKKLNELNQKAFDNAPKIEINDVELDFESRKIAEDYTYNMQYWVNKWEEKNIIKMRNDVLDMVQKGKRRDEIQDYFMKRWKIAKDKAAFLARNESNLAGSVIQKARFQKIGCTQFKWLRSSSKEKRELHKRYYDKIFDIDDPPIIDEKLGIKGLPRQIWNCGCHISYVVPSLAERLKNKEKLKQENTLINKVKNAIQSSTKCENNARRYRRFG